MARPFASSILAALLAVATAARVAPAGAVVARFGGDGPSVVDVAASPDGKTIATACADGDIRLWSASDGATRGALAGGRVAIHCIAFSPDGATLAAGRRDGAVVLWDVRAAQVTRQFAAYTRDATAVAFSPDGRLLATGGPNGGIAIWESDGGELLRRMTAVVESRVRRALNDPVRGLTFSPDGALLVSTHGGFDPFVHVWDPLTGREVTRLPERGEGLSAAVFAPDGATLATASDGGEVITLWETATWRVRRRLDARGAAEFPGAISPDGRTLWSVTLGDVYQWDLATGRRMRQLSGEHHGPITALAPVPAGLAERHDPGLGIGAGQDGVERPARAGQLDGLRP